MSEKSELVTKRIREMRETKNYTQVYVAGKLQISQNAYSKIEIGRSAVTIERLFAIAEILETTVINLISVQA